MTGVLMVMLGAAMWALAFTDVIPGVGGLMFIFFGGVCIGSGLVTAMRS